MMDTTKKFRRKHTEETLQRVKDEIVQNITEPTAGLSAMDQSLLKHSRLLEAFFHHALTPVVFLDRDFNFIRVNEAYAKACQKEVDDFPGHNHFEFYPSDAKVIFEEVVRTKQPFQISARPFVFPDHPDWGVTYWDWTLTPLFDDNGEIEILVFALEDVTAQKKAEVELAEYREYLEELVHERTRELEDANARLQKEIYEHRQTEESLRQSEQRFSLILKNAPVSVAAQDKDLRFIWAYNQRTIQPAEVIGKTDTDLFPPDDAGRLIALKRKVMETGRELSEQFWMISNDKRVFIDLYLEPLTNEAGEITGVGIATVDLTPMKRAEEKLCESEEKYRKIIETAGEGIVLAKPEGHYFFVNQRMADMLGYSMDEILGKSSVDFMYADDWRTQVIQLRSDLAQGSFLCGEFKFRRKDGSVLWSSYNASPVFNDKGEHIANLAMHTDITERKQTEEALRESEVKYRDLVENANSIIIKMDHKGQINFFNDYAQRFFGFSLDEILGKNVKILVPPVESISGRKLEEMADTILENPDVFTENINENILKNGKRVWISWRNKALKDLEGNIIGNLAIGQDITERKQLEEELKRANEELEERVRQRTEEVVNERQRLYSVLETLPVMICILTPDYHIPFANRSFRKKFGESNGRHCYEYCFGRTGPCEFCESFQVLETGKPHHWKVTGPDGCVIEAHDYPFTDWNGTPMILEMDIDITESIKYQEALAKEQELLMVTLNSLVEGVIATDSEDRIFLMNDAAVNLTGYSQMEAIDESLDKILYVINDRTSESVSNDVFQDNLQHQQMECNPVLVTRDLKEIPISMHSSPIKSADSNTAIGRDVIGAVIVIQDITEKQKIEQERFKTEKLESLGILAGGIAHDFNNLLAAILSNIQLAQLKYKKNEDIGKYLQESVNSTHRASELTRQLLTFSKGGAPVKKTTTLIELIQDTATFALRGSHIKVVCNIDNNLWPVEVDTGQISQVIHNLAINAKQAMPKGGVIEINAENITIESNHRFDPGNYIKIAVIDQGNGIPKEHLSKIFDPFFTTKREGSGLGLTTSYSIIRQHDGFLEVESQVGIGTTFFIYLPALLPTLVLSDAGDEAAVIAEGLKILLMDDEEAILKSVGEILGFYGHQVLMVPDGVKAIEVYCKAVENGVPFDVVIMDLTVPGGMGGQEAIAHLRDIDPKVKAIVSSGYANDPIMADYERFGFCGCVTKPYKFDELNEVLRRVVERKQLSLELNME